MNSLQEDTVIARQLGLVDLCGLVKTGVKGPGTSAWLEQKEFQLPAEPNSAVLQPNGVLVAKLSFDEFLILGDLKGLSGRFSDLEDNGSLASVPQTYLLPRGDSHCWLAVVGAKASQMLVKLCAIDLRTEQFPDCAIAQTIIADISVIVIRHDLGLTPCFYLLADIASTEYLWEVLLDAMQEFVGSGVGLAALHALLEQQPVSAM
jgi:sarcosine oxidase subunit gamma